MEPNMSGAPIWDQRYAATEYLFGTDPAALLVRHSDLLKPGSDTLVVADGEGRNSVFLASLGLRVTAMDVSEVGVRKACQLASDRGVTVDFKVADILDWDWTPDAYDLVVAVFIQFLNPRQRSTVFHGIQRTLRPGGRLLLHGYRPEQIQYATGGPTDPVHLYSETLLEEAFAEMQIDILRSYDAMLTEGSGHAGMSALIDLIATKRSLDQTTPAQGSHA
jgi:cyclopropane fatty-acyl-phospholipid synthase-like methyltransferase